MQVGSLVASTVVEHSTHYPMIQGSNRRERKIEKAHCRFNFVLLCGGRVVLSRLPSRKTAQLFIVRGWIGAGTVARSLPEVAEGGRSWLRSWRASLLIADVTSTICEGIMIHINLKEALFSDRYVKFRYILFQLLIVISI